MTQSIKNAKIGMCFSRFKETEQITRVKFRPGFTLFPAHKFPTKFTLGNLNNSYCYFVYLRNFVSLSSVIIVS